MADFSTTKVGTKANAITHGGIFHADEVMATVILLKIKELTVFRTFKVPEELDDGVIVYDIGGGLYDHHQKGGNGCRDNGVPYSSAGLIWKKYGPEICKNTADPDAVWEEVDIKLIQGIDAHDNGKLPSIEYPAEPMTVSTAIAGFNSNWDQQVDTDILFENAVLFAEKIFDNCLRRAIANAKGKRLVAEAVAKTEGQIMVLDSYLPWTEYLLKMENAANILFVISPALRGGWNWQCVPGSEGRFSCRKAVPNEWKGASSEELQKLTGVDDATFCHPAGFIGGAKTKEGAVKLAKLAAES